MLLTPQKPEVTDNKLLLGDYITVNVPGLESSEVNRDGRDDKQFRRESFIQRVQKQRGVHSKRIQEQGKLIDVRLRGAA